jgi:hypothetical protein
MPSAWVTPPWSRMFTHWYAVAVSGGLPTSQFAGNGLPAHVAIAGSGRIGDLERMLKPALASFAPDTGL